MKKAYSYIRMSTDTQKHGDSSRRQMAASEEYAKNNDLELVETIDDIGVSGYRGKNSSEGKLGIFIALLRDGSIDTGSFLLVEALDRLSRNTVHKAFSQFLEILEHDITIVTLQDGQVFTKESISDNESQIFITLGAMLSAHRESAIKSKRLLSSWSGKRESTGKKILTSRCPSWLKPNNDKTGFEEIPEAVKIVKQIFNWSIAGDGQFVITRRLNEKKIPPIGTAAQWNLSYIKKILNNKQVTGKFQPNRIIEGKRVPEGGAIENYYPAIISEADFLKVQKGLAQRKVGGGRKGRKYSNIFSKISKCGGCGSPLAYLDKGKRSAPTLKCRGAHQKTGCNSLPWNYEEFESAIFDSIREVDIQKILGKDSSSKQKDLEDNIIHLAEKIKIKEQNVESTANFLIEQNNDEVKNQLYKKLQLINGDVETLRNKQSLAESQLEEIKQEFVGDRKTAIIDLNNKLSSITDTDELYILRSSLAHELKSIIKQIKIYTNMSIYPWEAHRDPKDSDTDVFTGNCRKYFNSLGYKTDGDIEAILQKDYGKRLYVKYERYMQILFITGKSAILQPSANSYLEFKHKKKLWNA